MLQERGGWFVVNVRDADWKVHPAFGKRCTFEKTDPFPQTGFRLAVLEPDKPNCRYHRENAQEDFLVLSGECLLLVNDEQRRLQAWDFVHCPPGVSHVFVGAGNGPCVILMIGHRPEKEQIFYPGNAAARRYGAEAPEPTSHPRTAYSDVPAWEGIAPPAWPLR